MVGDFASTTTPQDSQMNQIGPFLSPFFFLSEPNQNLIFAVDLNEKFVFLCIRICFASSISSEKEDHAKYELN
ncbi:hypothetical protein BLOT_004300 [Blomia tropicalis]|nr:hypothetical protein BLOT_004300 [Blomia tropicalis]